MTNVALKSGPTTGIFDAIPQEAYRKLMGISSTGLRYLAQSPAHYQEYLRNPPEQTPAMLLGTAIHSAVLEGGIDTGAIVRGPDADKRTKEWKEFEAANAGKLILKPDQFDIVQGAVLAVAKHPTASRLLNPTQGKAEQTAIWVDPETGVLCKARPDFLRDDGIVVDLKSSLDASSREFQKSLMNYHYHWQTAFYLDGLTQLLGEPLSQFVHIVVEKSAPFGVACYVLDDASIERSRVDVRKLMELYAECEKTGQWPGYVEGIQDISLPTWAW